MARKWDSYDYVRLKAKLHNFPPYDWEDDVELMLSEIDRLGDAANDLIELAKLVAQDYEDSADWKDARGKLYSMARAALDKVGVATDLPGDE